jgi:hypothetical protein
MRELQTQLPICLPNGKLGIPLMRAEFYMLPYGTPLLDKFGREFKKGYRVVEINHISMMTSIYKEVL